MAQDVRPFQMMQIDNPTPETLGEAAHQHDAIACTCGTFEHDATEVDNVEDS